MKNFVCGEFFSHFILSIIVGLSLLPGAVIVVFAILSTKGICTILYGVAALLYFNCAIDFIDNVLTGVVAADKNDLLSGYNLCGSVSKWMEELKAAEDEKVLAEINKDINQAHEAYGLATNRTLSWGIDAKIGELKVALDGWKPNQTIQPIDIGLEAVRTIEADLAKLKKEKQDPTDEELKELLKATRVAMVDPSGKVIFEIHKKDLDQSEFREQLAHSILNDSQKTVEKDKMFPYDALRAAYDPPKPKWTAMFIPEINKAFETIVVGPITTTIKNDLLNHVNRVPYPSDFYFLTSDKKLQIFEEWQEKVVVAINEWIKKPDVCVSSYMMASKLKEIIKEVVDSYRPSDAALAAAQYECIWNKTYHSPQESK